MLSRSALVLTIALCVVGCRSDDKKNNGNLDARIPPGTDGAVPPGNEGGVIPNDGGVPTSTTIFKITSGEVKEGESVVLDEVIITAVDGYDWYVGDLYVQDPRGGPGSGLRLYQPERADGGEIVSLKPCDHVKVEGKVKYYVPEKPYDDPNHPNKVHIKQLDRPRVTHLLSDTAPQPAVVTVEELTEDPTAEGWESVLVQVQNVAVTAPVNPEYGEFPVSGGLSIADELYPGEPKRGDCLTITGISAYYYAYRLNPRDAGDLQPGAGCPPLDTWTIKDLQDETSPNHPASESSITVTGVITAVDGTPSGTPPTFVGFWIQDGSGPYSGIAVKHEWQESSPRKPKLGDTVEVSGTYEEFYDRSQIYKPTFTTGSPGTVPAPEVIADPADIATGGSKAEQYEGVLVEVQNVEVEGLAQTTGNPPRTVGVTLKGSGLRLEADLYGELASNPPAAGTKYSAIRGVLDYTYSTFKILPRSAADLVQAP